MNTPVKNLQQLGYEFHIDQKHETKNWQIEPTFLFSSDGIPIGHQHTDSHPCIRPIPTPALLIGVLLFFASAMTLPAWFYAEVLQHMQE